MLACTTGACLAFACGAAAPVAAELTWAPVVDAQLASDPGDGGALYLAAMVARSRGDRAGALRVLSRLDALGWDLGLPDEDFAGLGDRRGYRELVRAAAAREPHVTSSERLFTVDERTLTPEGIAFDSRTGAYFLGSICGHKIVRVVDGVATDLVPGGRDGLGAVLGLHVDERPGGLLWAVYNPVRSARGGRSGIVGLDPTTGALRHHATIAGGHLLNDLAISDAGDIYVTETMTGAVRRLRAGERELAPFIAPGTFVYPNGIAWSRDAGRLLVADALGITVVDAATGARRRLGRGPALSIGAIDGLAVRGRTLVAVQNGYGLPRIVRFDVDAGLTHVERVQILEAGNPLFDSPTTGVIAGDGFTYIANSQVHRCRDGQLVDPGTMQATVVLRAPLPR